MSCDKVENLFEVTAKQILKDSDRLNMSICDCIERRHKKMSIKTKEAIVEEIERIIIGDKKD